MVPWMHTWQQRNWQKLCRIEELGGDGEGQGIGKEAINVARRTGKGFFFFLFFGGWRGGD